MYLPEQRESLEQLVADIADGCDEPTNVFYPTMSSPEDFRVKLKCFDIGAIKKYFEDALTENHHHDVVVTGHEEHIKYWPYDEKSEEEMEVFIERNPDFQKTFKFFNDVLATYLKDLSSAADRAGLYKISGNIQEIQDELEKEEMLSEGLPQILHDFDDQARMNPKSTNFFSGLRRMLQEGRFANEENRCPFGMRVCDIFSFKPERDPTTKQVKITGSQEGALIEFIYEELTQASMPKVETSAVSENVAAND